MSEPAALPHREALPPTNEPLRIAVRRLRWFRSAFARYAEACGEGLGCGFTIDEPRLARAFASWLKAIELQRPKDKSERRDFFEFAAGLMLRELIAEMPLAATCAPGRADPASAGAFWPEGYVCTLFCLTVHAAALEEEFHASPDLGPGIADLRQWWSLRENANLDRSFPAGFLQMLLGHQPNWSMPDVFRARMEREIG